MRITLIKKLYDPTSRRSKLHLECKHEHKNKIKSELIKAIVIIKRKIAIYKNKKTAEISSAFSKLTVNRACFDL